MARITIGFDEFLHQEVPEICICCGRRARELVWKKFTYRPLWQVSVFYGVTRTYWIELPVPVCRDHADVITSAWRTSLRAVKLFEDAVQLKGVSDDFADELEHYRSKRKLPYPRLAVPEKPEKYAAGLRTLGTFALVVAGVVGVSFLGLIVMLLGLMFYVEHRPHRRWAPAPPAVKVVAPMPENLKENMLLWHVAPVAPFPANVPWAGLCRSSHRRCSPEAAAAIVAAAAPGGINFPGNLPWSGFVTDDRMK